jgi:phosphoglycerol transferase MdoB-like AlkP superfamily enzyme
MSSKATTIEILFEKVEDYTRTTVELAKLKVIDTSADVLSSLISRLIIAIVFAMFMLLLNFGFSFWIGELLGNFYFGFFIMAVIYLILSIVLYSYKDQWIKMPISDFIITKMLKNK